MPGRLAHAAIVAGVLDVNKLFGALELFCDPSAPGAQFPTDNDDAAKKWGAAWQLYFDDLAPLPPGSPSAGTTFTATLAFGPSLGVPDPAHDLAKAWHAAMTAALPAFDGLAGREFGLRTELQGLFAAPSILASQRVEKIAEAFHHAMTIPPLTSNGGTTSYS